MHYHTQIKILDLDHLESIVQEITVAEAEKIVGGNVPEIKVEPATNECIVLSGGNCSCQGENKECWLRIFPLRDPHNSDDRVKVINQAINQSYLNNFSITSLIRDQ